VSHGAPTGTSRVLFLLSSGLKTMYFHP